MIRCDEGRVVEGRIAGGRSQEVERSAEEAVSAAVVKVNKELRRFAWNGNLIVVSTAVDSCFAIGRC